eukprot:4541453-Amphidinium_carterae.1
MAIASLFRLAVDNVQPWEEDYFKDISVMVRIGNFSLGVVAAGSGFGWGSENVTFEADGDFVYSNAQAVEAIELDGANDEPYIQEFTASTKTSSIPRHTMGTSFL